MARRVLIAAAVLPVLASAYAVIAGRLSGWESGAYYVLAPLLLSGLLASALRFRVTTQVNLSLALVATAAAIYSSEAILALVEASRRVPVCEGMPAVRRDHCRFALKRGLPFDVRAGREVIETLKGSEPGRLVVPNMGFPVETHQSAHGPVTPLGGIANALTVYCAETGRFEVFVSDEHGFRNPAPWDSLAVGVTLIGDSFTKGHCVDDETSIAGRLRAAGLSVLNLGVDGAGPLRELAIVKEYALRLEPSQVVWLYYEGNDLKRHR